MSWYDDIIDIHLSVTDEVSHAEHMQSDRYFVWQEDGRNDLIASDKHVEKAITGSTDLYTKIEFDEWKDEIEEAFENAGILWEYASFQYEEETGFFHHEWYWELI